MNVGGGDAENNNNNNESNNLQKMDQFGNQHIFGPRHLRNKKALIDKNRARTQRISKKFDTGDKENILLIKNAKSIIKAIKENVHHALAKNPDDAFFSAFSNNNNNCHNEIIDHETATDSPVKNWESDLEFLVYGKINSIASEPASSKFMIEMAWELAEALKIDLVIIDRKKKLYMKTEIDEGLFDSEEMTLLQQEGQRYLYLERCWEIDVIGRKSDSSSSPSSSSFSEDYAYQSYKDAFFFRYPPDADTSNILRATLDKNFQSSKNIINSSSIQALLSKNEDEPNFQKLMPIAASDIDQYLKESKSGHWPAYFEHLKRAAKWLSLFFLSFMVILCAIFNKLILVRLVRDTAFKSWGKEEGLPIYLLINIGTILFSELIPLIHCTYVKYFKSDESKWDTKLFIKSAIPEILDCVGQFMFVWLIMTNLPEVISVCAMSCVYVLPALLSSFSIENIQINRGCSRFWNEFCGKIWNFIGLILQAVMLGALVLYVSVTKSIACAVVLWE